MREGGSGGVDDVDVDVVGDDVPVDVFCCWRLTEERILDGEYELRFLASEAMKRKSTWLLLLFPCFGEAAAVHETRELLIFLMQTKAESVKK